MRTFALHTIAYICALVVMGSLGWFIGLAVLGNGEHFASITKFLSALNTSSQVSDDVSAAGQNGRSVAGSPQAQDQLAEKDGRPDQPAERVSEFSESPPALAESPKVAAPPLADNSPSTVKENQPDQPVEVVGEFGESPPAPDELPKVDTPPLAGNPSGTVTEDQLDQPVESISELGESPPAPDESPKLEDLLMADNPSGTVTEDQPDQPVESTSKLGESPPAPDDSPKLEELPVADIPSGTVTEDVRLPEPSAPFQFQDGNVVNESSVATYIPAPIEAALPSVENVSDGKLAVAEIGKPVNLINFGKWSGTRKTKQEPRLTGETGQGQDTQPTAEPLATTLNPKQSTSGLEVNYAEAPMLTSKEAETKPTTASDGGAVQSNLSVIDMTLTRDVVDKLPVDITETFSASDGQAYAYARIKNLGTPTEVIFAWYNGGRLQTSVKLKVGWSHSWRTWSKATIQPGAWRVQVSDENGRVLGESAFTVE